MTARGRRADGIAPRHSRRARAAAFLERWLRRSVVVGTRGLVASSGLFFAYLATDWLLVVLDSAWAPPKLFSMAADPGFLLTATLVALFTVLGCGSLVLYHLLTGADDARTHFVLLTSSVGLGCGAAALRILLPPTVTFLGDWV